MQSESDTFRGDVVLESVIMAYRDEDRILDQIYQKQIFSDFIMKIYYLRVIEEYAYLKKYSTILLLQYVSMHFRIMI